jgi:hypothetical protein
MKNKETIYWVAKEGNETFKFQAEDYTQALRVCLMYNAVLIGKE